MVHRMASKGSGIGRAWDKEARSWKERPGYWRYYTFLSGFFLVQAVFAFVRGAPWVAGFGVVGAVLVGALATLAYRASHAR
jgi:uncharacterized membrane protein